MKIRSVFVAAVAVACMGASTAVYARTADTPSLTYVGFTKSKTVTFSLRNDSGAAMELKVGDSVMTIESGKTVKVKLPVGTRIVTNTATATRKAGSLVEEVSNDLSDATITLR
ncbi:MAG: hypothetical protein ABI197_01775 [Granulicella sp.]